MKKITLSPFVHMVKGAKNYALYDLLDQRLFGISPEGNIDDLKKQLVEANLVVGTDGVIPFKYERLWGQAGKLKRRKHVIRGYNFKGQARQIDKCVI